MPLTLLPAPRIQKSIYISDMWYEFDSQILKATAVLEILSSSFFLQKKQRENS